MISLSIVTTTFQSRGTILEFLNRMTQAANKLKINFEIIVIDDGSTDETRLILKDSLNKIPELKVLFLTRNFGHHKAILAGLEKAIGKSVFLIDSDLEEAPELLIEFFEKFSAGDSDVIYGFQTQRNDKGPRKILGKQFWKFFKWISNSNIPLNICTIRIMSAKYVKALLKYPESEVFLAGIWYDAGFKQEGIPVSKNKLKNSTYSFSRRVRLAITSIVSHSSKPLYVVGLLGILLTLLGLLLGGIQLLAWMTGSEYQRGWLSLFSAIILLGGFQILAISILMLYVAMVLSETKKRPRYLIEFDSSSS